MLVSCGDSRQPSSSRHRSCRAAAAPRLLLPNTPAAAVALFLPHSTAHCTARALLQSQRNKIITSTQICFSYKLSVCAVANISAGYLCSHIPWLSPCSGAVLQCCSRSQPRSHVLAARQVIAGHCVVLWVTTRYSCSKIQKIIYIK